MISYPGPFLPCESDERRLALATVMEQCLIARRTGCSSQFPLPHFPRQSIYSRLRAPAVSCMLPFGPETRSEIPEIEG